MDKRDDSASLKSAIEEAIKIHPYDSNWPTLFQTEKARLQKVFVHDMIEIEHIGSTSVPGLAAKPIVDLMAGVRTMEIAESLLAPLRQYGYVTPPECNAELVDRRWLMRHAGGHRTHHLHLVVLRSKGWDRTMRFRDALRADPKAAQQYSELKYRLAAEAGTNRNQYVQAKSDFIDKLINSFSKNQRV